MLRYMMHNCPINCLFAAELLPGFGAISQSLSRRSEAPLFSRPSSLFCPLSSFLWPVFMYWGREQQSHHHHLDERWSHHRPSPIAAAPTAIGRGRVLRNHDNHTELVKGRPVKPKTFFFFFFFLNCILFFSPCFLNVLIAAVRRGLAGEEGE